MKIYKISYYSADCLINNRQELSLSAIIFTNAVKNIDELDVIFEIVGYPGNEDIWSEVFDVYDIMLAMG